MLARKLLGGILLEASLGALIAWRAVQAHGFVLWEAALLVLALALGYRAVVVLGMFAISEASRCARPKDMRLGLLEILRLFIAEWWAYTLLYTVYHPFVRHFVLTDPPEEHRKGVPIVLIHGFFCNAGYWKPMLPVLESAGYRNIWLISLEPIGGDIEHLAGQLGKRVEEVCEKCGTDKVILVGHSMGGLVSRAYARKAENAARVLHIVTLGTPHHGTVHSRFSAAKNARQMRRGNTWLAELNGEDRHPATPSITSIYSLHDNIVAPQDSPHLEHAENVALAGIGHLEMSFSKVFQGKVLEALGRITG